MRDRSTNGNDRLRTHADVSSGSADRTPVRVRTRARAYVNNTENASACVRNEVNQQVSARDTTAPFLVLDIPIRTVPGQNAREHWAVRARRVKRERQAVALVWRSRRLPWLPFDEERPYLVTLTRISPRGMADSDNLSGALKAIRDQVAAEMGFDDGPSAPIRWSYAQERGAWGVRIEVREAHP